MLALTDDCPSTTDFEFELLARVYSLILSWPDPEEETADSERVIEALSLPAAELVSDLEPTE
jgi:hypothetical protein